MPFWCGYDGAGGGFWWFFPLLGLLVMGIMAFACFRGFGQGFGCLTRRAGRAPDEVAELRRELQELKDDVSKLLQRPG